MPYGAPSARSAIKVMFNSSVGIESQGMKAPVIKTATGVMLAVVILLVGCRNDSNQPSPTDSKAPDRSSTSQSDTVLKTVIQPGPNAQTEAQEAFILAEPGDVIEFAEGKFEFDGSLSIDGVADLVVRGQGMEKTVLNFANFQAGKGGTGFEIKADNFTIEDLTIEDTPGDAVKLQDCNGITMRRIRTWWTKGPDTKNGAYGLYPVLSENVLIEECVAEGASDAGIYVGQSKQVVVRNCVAEKNVAGIEIENCVGADVYENETRNNTGGILVFSLPGLTIKNGSRCRVFDNRIQENNHPNFAETGAMVATVPAGTGLMIMANDEVEVFENQFSNNQTANCLIVSFMIAQRKFDDDQYDPYSESIHVHDNSFTGGGQKPDGEHLRLFHQATGQAVPDIVYDGIVDSKKLVDGEIPTGLQLSIHDNGDANFVNLDLGSLLAGEQPEFKFDMEPYAAPLSKLDAISIPDDR